MADTYVIGESEAKVKNKLFTNDFSSGEKEFQEVYDENGEKKIIEVTKRFNLVLEDTRKGSHNAKEESYIRNCIADAQTREAHNIVRQQHRLKRIENWQKLTEEERQEILKRYPNYMRKLKIEPIQDDLVKLYMTTAYAVSNLSVSSTSDNRRPISTQFFTPHTSSEQRQYTTDKTDPNKQRGNV